MAHQYMPKIFHEPHKNPQAPPPMYLMYGPLANYYIASKNCQHNSNVLYTFIPNKSFGQLLDISLKHLIFLKTFNSEFSEFRIIQNILVYGLLIKILNHQR